MKQLTKVQAVIKVLKKYRGSANWQTIYREIEKFYPAAKASNSWQEGIRGVVYREIRSGRTFKIENKGVVVLVD